MVAIAGSRVAGSAISGAGSSITGGWVLGTPHPRVFPDTPDDLAIPSPILQFYELETADGSYVRVVDFGDEEAGSSPRTVDYDSKVWTSVHLGKPNLEESLDGRSPRLTVQIQDPDGTVVQFVRDHGNLRGAKVHLDIISYSDLSSPEVAISRSFLVRGVKIQEGPLRVGITFSAPSLHDLQYPAIKMSRLRCVNDWQRRHTWDGYNFCSYPSDDFEEQTRQIFVTSADTETELLHGWYVLNGSKPSYWKSGVTFTGSDRRLEVDDTGSYTALQWKDSNRLGPFAYKLLPSTGELDFDVWTKVVLLNGSPNDEWYAGLLIQPSGSETNWIFWGHREKNGGGIELLKRVTTSGTSADTTVAATDNSLRVTRSGTSWTFYSRAETPGDKDIPTGSWTQRTTSTFTMSGELRVGLMAGVDNATQIDINAAFYYLRFFAGGYTTCDRTLASCQARKNTIQRNAFLSLPDAIIAF